MSTSPQEFVTNLELRASNPDGTEGEGLSHKSMAGLFLLSSIEVAAPGEPRGGLTFLHGLGDHGLRYRDLAYALAEDGWAVALPDMRGHGGSEGPRGHCLGLPEIYRDLDAVHDHLAYRMGPDVRRVLMAQGVGAVQAMCYAVERPGTLDALVLVGPILEPKYTAPTKPGGVRGLFKKLGPESAGSFEYAPDALTGVSSEQAAYANDPKVHGAITLRTIEVLKDAAGHGARWPSIDCPVLLVQGAEDTLASPAATQALARDGWDYRELEGVRHDVFHDVKAEQTVALVRAWLNDKLA
jgi:alpha-beta hydrolase superfamily lysophospholipase